jgi:hypothetical protein
MTINRYRRQTIALTYTTLLVVLVLGAMPRPVLAANETEKEHEYQVKAAFMYNFLLFVEGFRFQQKVAESEEDETEDDRAVTIGIIGKDPFGKALKPLQQRRIRDHKVVIKHFKGMSELLSEDEEIKQHPDHEGLSRCDLLYVSNSEAAYLDLILKPLKEQRVLTVGESSSFIERGGMIGLVTDDYKIRFEVNTIVARQAHLTMRSKLLRLARRVIKADED